MVAKMRIAMLALGLALTGSAPAAVVLYTDEGAWLEAVVAVEGLDTTAADVGLADETAAPTTDNVNVGDVLTFQAGSTGLSRSFRLSTLEAGADFTYGDHSLALDSSQHPALAAAIQAGSVVGVNARSRDQAPRLPMGQIHDQVQICRISGRDKHPGYFGLACTIKHSADFITSTQHVQVSVGVYPM